MFLCGLPIHPMRFPRGRNEIMTNLTHQLRELAGDQSPEVHQASRSVTGDAPLMSPARREETETTIERETTEELGDLNLKR
jgi:hypothetical protein